MVTTDFMKDLVGELGLDINKDELGDLMGDDKKDEEEKKDDDKADKGGDG